MLSKNSKVDFQKILRNNKKIRNDKEKSGKEKNSKMKKRVKKKSNNFENSKFKKSYFPNKVSIIFLPHFGLKIRILSLINIDY